MKKQNNQLEDLKDVLDMYRETTLDIVNGKLDERASRGVHRGLRGILGTLRTKVDRINKIRSKEIIHYIDDAKI